MNGQRAAFFAMAQGNPSSQAGAQAFFQGFNFGFHRFGLECGRAGAAQFSHQFFGLADGQVPFKDGAQDRNLAHSVAQAQQSPGMAFADFSFR